MESRQNPVRFDTDDSPSAVYMKSRSQIFLTNRVRSSIGTLIAETQYVQSCTSFRHRCQTRRVSWLLFAIESVEQPTVQHRLEFASQVFQMKRVSYGEFSLESAFASLPASHRQRGLRNIHSDH